MTDNFISVSGKYCPDVIKLLAPKGYNVFWVQVMRDSGKEDTVCILIKDSYNLSKTDQYCTVKGALTTMKVGAKTFVCIIAETIKFHNEPIYSNKVFLKGVIGKFPNMRVTKDRYILDLCLRLNSKNFENHEIYVPCIAFNKCAMVAQNLTVGSHIAVKGRLQSRSFLHTRTNTIRSIEEVAIFKMTILGYKSKEKEE